MKKFVPALAVVFLLVGLTGFVTAGQNPFSYIANVFSTGGATLLKTDSQGILLSTHGGPSFHNGITTSTVIKVGAGRIDKISVTTAGAAGAVYDSATVGGVSSSNLIVVVPASVTVLDLQWPVTNGIVYVPGSAQVASASYQ